MTKTLVLLFHPDMARSKTNSALARAAAKIATVEVVHMQAIHSNRLDFIFDGEREAARLLAADRIVLQFPMQWYSTPPLLKAWQDVVLTRMFYVAYDAEGRKLEGTPLIVAATVGNVPDTYRPGGANLFSMDDLFAPLKATANRCGLRWAKPFLVYRADKLTSEELESAADAYGDALSRWIAETPVRKAA